MRVGCPAPFHRVQARDRQDRKPGWALGAARLAGWHGLHTPPSLAPAVETRKVWDRRRIVRFFCHSTSSPPRSSYSIHHHLLDPRFPLLLLQHLLGYPAACFARGDGRTLSGCEGGRFPARRAREAGGVRARRRGCLVLKLYGECREVACPLLPAWLPDTYDGRVGSSPVLWPRRWNIPTYLRGEMGSGLRVVARVCPPNPWSVFLLPIPALGKCECHCPRLWVVCHGHVSQSASQSGRQSGSQVGRPSGVKTDRPWPRAVSRREATKNIQEHASLPKLAQGPPPRPFAPSTPEGGRASNGLSAPSWGPPGCCQSPATAFPLGSCFFSRLEVLVS